MPLREEPPQTYGMSADANLSANPVTEPLVKPAVDFLVCLELLLVVTLAADEALALVVAVDEVLVALLLVAVVELVLDWAVVVAALVWVLVWFAELATVAL